MEDDKNTKLDQQLDRNITLESLLDAPPSKNACKRKISDSNNYVIHPVPPNKRPRGQMTQAKEASLELIAILLQQDVNGFFHFTPKKHDGKLTNLSLRVLERYIHTNKVKNLAHLREFVEELFSSFQINSINSSNNSSVPPAGPLEGWSAVCAEANRLSLIARRWFDSIGAESELMRELIYPQVDDSQEVTALGLLNPDNKGLVSATERVRTIGEEVGPVNFGTHLSPNGGYREDRRNRVIPYTYLNYGPYSTFGPSFDSGASNCSPEANQLLLSTTWLPARMLYSLEEVDVTPGKNGENELDECPWSRLRCVPEAEDDAELQTALADCIREWKESKEATKDLEEIVPAIIYGNHPDGDFGLYLANAITRNLPLETDGDNKDKTAGASLNAPMETIKKPEPKEEGSKMEDIKTEENKLELSNEEKNVEMLAKSSHLLRDLYNAQHRRLGDFSEPSLADERILRPGRREVQTAIQLASTLVGLVGRMTRGPGDILISRAPVRRALGLDPDAPVLPPSPAEKSVDLTSE